MNTTERLALEPLGRLSRDLKKGAGTISRQQARFLVDAYYQLQEDRKRTANQVRAVVESGEPHDVLDWLLAQNETLEHQIARALDSFSAAHPVGEWARDQVGIGPVIAAGLLAHIDIERAPTVGHIWSFAGLDPTKSWNKGEKRPWNAALKVLCWKIGESFVKSSTNVDSYYGPLYVERKAYEIHRNESGGNVVTAQRLLEQKNFGAETDARAWLSGCFTAADAQHLRDADPAKRATLTKKLQREPGSGLAMLPPAQIHARAKRWAVKLFLAHFHAVYYQHHFGVAPPLPYPIAHLGHAHAIPAPV